MSTSLIKYITTVIVVYAIIFVVIFRDKTKEYLNQNWREIRCHPHIIPIAGLADRAEGNGFIDKSVNNFNQCSAGFIKTTLDIFMRPLMALLNGLKKALESITNMLDVFRRMSKVLREMYATLVQNTVKRMSNSYAAVLYFQEKLKLIIKKQSALFEIFSQFAGTMPFIIYSFMNGPIVRWGVWLGKYVGLLIAILVICIACKLGGPFVKMVACPICAVCFPGNTLVDVNDTKKIAIKDIHIGDKIRNNIVKGKIYIKPHLADTYRYKNIIVSGSHLVFENNHWIRVEDSQNAKKETKNTELYCLITSDNTIFIDNTKFRDYEEIKDRDIKLAINYKFARFINNNIGYIKTPDDIKHCYYWGFSADNLIELDGKVVILKNIIKNPERYDDILGIVELKDNVKMYNYKGIQVSGNTLVLENNLWVRVFQSPFAQEIEYKDRIYNVITSDNIVKVRNDKESILFRDFVESNKDEINDNVDKMVESRLNLIFDFDASN